MFIFTAVFGLYHISLPASPQIMLFLLCWKSSRKGGREGQIEGREEEGGGREQEDSFVLRPLYVSICSDKSVPSCSLGCVSALLHLLQTPSPSDRVRESCRLSITPQRVSVWGVWIGTLTSGP